MGSIIGAGIGLAGSLLGGSSKKSADSTAAQQNLTGFNYLNGNQANKTAQGAGVDATGAAANTQGAEAQLLGTAPITDQTKNGFNNYLNSTGYNFQKSQGTSALTGAAGARGLRDSGSTAKALTTYGQNIAGQSFNNYLNNLSGLNTQQQATANAGTAAAGQVGTAGTSGGAGASTATQAGGNAMGDAIGTAAGIGAKTITDNAKGIGNFIGGLF